MADADRINQRLAALWDIAHGPGGGADRPAYSPAEAEAMLLVAGWARGLGLEPGIDAHGNLWALPAGWDGPLLTSGSHVDTVPDGGRWDGALGTALGLELVADLAELDRAELTDRADAADPAAARPALLVCAAEEAPRFSAGTIGSRLLVGTLAPDALEDLTDERGVTAAAAQRDYLDALRELPRIDDPPLQRIRAHAEVHVALRRELRQLGVVTRVASPRRFTVTLVGEAGHAGEVPMADRRDALAAAAEVVLAVEAAATAEPPETVATVGALAVEPGAVSVIPAQARLGIDLRAVDSDSLSSVDAAIRLAVEEISERRGVGANVRLVRSGEPVTLDPGLAAAALEGARRLGIPAVETWSGSGHDSQHLSSVFPALLVFVPLHGGEGHTPHEGADIGEVLQAASLVALVLGQGAA